MEDLDLRPTLDLGTGTELARIVVPITLDHRFDRGVSLAARLAERWQLPVRLVSADLSAPGEVSLGLGEALQQAASSLRAAHPGLSVSDELVAGDDAVDAVAATLEPGDLVVVATAGAEVHDRAASFAQSLAHTWGGPIVMVGPNAAIDRLDGDIVVGVDGSALAERALPVATGLAAAIGAHVWVVEVVPRAVTDHVEQLKARGERVSENAYVRDVVARLGGTAASWEIVHDEDPATALVDVVTARGAALLVMATHGRTGVLRPWFGSVCMAAVRQSSRPVVVIRPSSSGPELTLT